MNISVSMIVMNEEKNIERALSSCTFADEIVVVDGGSTDRTVEILKTHPRVKLFHNPMPRDFGKQRQISLSHCTGDWVIRLDADEAFCQEFENNIRDLLVSTSSDVVGYMVRQCNLVGNENYYSKIFDDYEAGPRIWRRLPEIMWERPAHEILVGFPGKIGLWDIYIVHYGFLNRRRYWEKAIFNSQYPGTGFNSPEELFYREYDFQPRPLRSKTSPHVPPFEFEKDHGGLPKVAIIRGPNLNLWEMQNYEPLVNSFDITAYTTTKPNFDLEKIKLPIVKLSPDPQNPAYMTGLEFALFNKDLIYTADITWLFSYQAVLAKEKFGKKVVCLEWENIPFAYEENDQMKALKERVRQVADHFIAVTERAKDALVLEGVPSDKITVIPMGIDTERFKPDRSLGQDLRKELGIGPEEKVVLFTGRMVWEKGIYDLICAAKLSLQETNGIPVKFVIIGKGPETETVRRRVRELGIESSVIFIESYPYHEMHRMYNLADIFVLPSISTRMWKEQFGMVLAEAMACGTPVVSTTSGSIPEVVSDAGVLVQSNDPRDLAMAIVKLLKDENLRKELSSKGRERSVKEFNSQEIAQRIGRLFEDILQPVKKPHLITEKPPGYFSQERLEILQRVPEGVNRVLDVGCGAGHLGKGLKERGVEEVVGIEINQEAASEAKKYLDHVIVGDVEETILPFEEGHFDAIIFADILEHLRNPKDVLDRYTRYLSDNGTIIASIPNVRNFEVINRLVGGRWTYQDSGIMDKDHLRFFTFKDMRDMLELSGLFLRDLSYNIDSKYYQIKTNYPADLNIGRMTLRGLSKSEVIDIFVVQYIFTVNKINQTVYRESIRELASYTGLSIEDVGSRIKTTCAQQMQEWRARFSKDGLTQQRVNEFYRDTETYLFDLTRFNYGNALYSEWTVKIKEACREFAAEQDMLDILDFGGGIGSQLINLSGLKNVRLYYADMPGKTYDYAKWRFQQRGLDVNILDAGKEDFIGASQFDVIMMIDVLEHMVESEKIVKYLIEHLNPGGYLIMTVPFHNDGDGFDLHLNEDKYSSEGFYRIVKTLGMEMLNNDLPRIFRKAYEEDCSNLLSEVDSAIVEERFMDAKNSIESYLEMHTLDLELLLKYADVCIKLGDYTAASESLEKVLLFKPDLPEAMEIKRRIVVCQER